MKILYHHRVRSRDDGQSVHLEELIEALRELEHSVRLVGPRAFEQDAFGSEPHRLQNARSLIPPAMYEILELGYNLVAFIRLLAVTIRFRPDVIYERYNLYSLAGVCVSKLLSLPLLLEVNAPLAEERASFGGLAFSRWARALENWTWRSATVVLPVTTVLAGHVERGGVPRHKIHVVPNAVNLTKFAHAPDATRSKESTGLSGKVVVGFIGFARPWHGLEAIIELLAHPDTPQDLHALIVGSGPSIEGLKKRAAELSVSQKVTFAGLVDHAKIPTYLAAFDVALVPSCVDYCSPLKLFEYMILGKAIVAPDQLNIQEILTHGLTALLFSPKVPSSMSSAVQILATDSDLRNRIGTAARSLIFSRGFTWKHNAERVTEFARRAAMDRAEPVAQ